VALDRMFHSVSVKQGVIAAIVTTNFVLYRIYSRVFSYKHNIINNVLINYTITTTIYIIKKSATINNKYGRHPHFFAHQNFHGNKNRLFEIYIKSGHVPSNNFSSHFKANFKQGNYKFYI
jgi:hypothetical protein